MNKKFLATVIALAMVMLTTPFIGMVYAKPSTPVSGTIVLTDVVATSPPKVAGNSDNRFIVMAIEEQWDGDIVATGTTISYWTVHNAPLFVNPDAWVNVHEKLILDGEILGVSGTVTMELVVSGTKGHWTIIDGTGGLANVHGQGKLSLETMPYSYTGKVHFDP